MYGITEKYNTDRRGGQALQSLCGRLCGILHKTNEWDGTEQRHCHCAVWQTDNGEWCGLSVRLWFGETEFLQKPVRHLSQAQEQEIEKLRKKYFPEMTFLGYQILNGEMVEGFRICEQEICRYVAGYAQFYEKNDSMLAYMLENRGEEAEPEKLDQEKYEVVKKRQEERRQRQESGHAGRVEYTGRAEHRDNIIPMPTEGLHRMKMAATGVFVLLCVMALALMRQENTGESLEETARQAMSSLMEQKLPDAVEEQNQVSTLVAEDKLEAALRQENNAMAENATATAETTVPETMEAEAAVEDTTEVTEEPQPEVTPTPEPTPEVTVESETPQTQAAVAQPTAYTIKKGDTLIGISLRNYGSNTKVSEICALNGITDPDDIKIGQEILLP